MRRDRLIRLERLLGQDAVPVRVILKTPWRTPPAPKSTRPVKRKAPPK